jgi:hypothetical protein
MATTSSQTEHSTEILEDGDLYSVLPNSTEGDQTIPKQVDKSLVHVKMSIFVTIHRCCVTSFDLSYVIIRQVYFTLYFLDIIVA